MPNLDLIKVARVLDLCADALDAQEYARQTAAESEFNARAARVKEKYAALTGNELPPESLKPDALIAVEAALEKVAAGPAGENLGGPGDRSTHEAPKTKAERMQAAEERFLRWATE